MDTSYSQQLFAKHFYGLKHTRLHLAQNYARFVPRHSLFRGANSFPRAKVEEKLGASRNRLCPRTNIRTYFRAKWRLLCLLSFKYFYTRMQCGTPFLEAFKRQSNYLVAQNIVSLFTKCLALFILTIYSG